MKCLRRRHLQKINTTEIKKRNEKARSLARALTSQLARTYFDFPQISSRANSKSTYLYLYTSSTPDDPEKKSKIPATMVKQLFSILLLQLGMSAIHGFMTIAPHQRKLETALRVSEIHIPGYRQTKIPFILKDEDLIGQSGSVLTALEEGTYTSEDYESQMAYESGHLLHKTTKQVFTSEECRAIVNEAETVAVAMGWTTNRHGNYPTTDIPIIELPETLQFLRKSLVQRIYPLLREQFKEFLPPGNAPFKLRVADGFIVKYDVEGGQSELKPHRDGSVLSFNIALNPADEYVGGGTWFDSLKDAVKLDEGEMVSHASGVLHGGHAITSGKRYIIVAFVILEGYDSWSMRFYNNVRNV